MTSRSGHLRERLLRILAPFLAIAFVASGLFAAEAPEILPRACEERLALSAAPEHLREGAGLWVLEASGYEQVRESRNGFTCIVNRDHPWSLKPVCLDGEGSRVVLPKIRAVGSWLLDGLSPEEIQAAVAEGFANGTFTGPERPGVAYMLSHYNRPWNPAARAPGWFPPHVMFLAPGATNSEVGFSPEAFASDPILPLVGYQGPHGFYIVRQALRAEPWNHPVPDCPRWVLGRHGELPAEARQFDFWLGRWDVNLRIRADGAWPESSVRAVAEIYSILDGKAVLELWDSEPILGYSLRYFDVARDEWVLWLNWPGVNRSGSSSLSGGFRHGRGDFFAERPTPEGGTRISRYSFNDITPTSLRWDDAYSSDGGETWRNQWRMEFTRTGSSVSLRDDGGDAHTLREGTRCDLLEFRRFDALVGSREGTRRTRSGDGQWDESSVRLVGLRALGGCAVLARILPLDGGTATESFHHLTWNTYASVFEETLLDSRPGTPARILYGAASEEEITLSERSDGSEPTMRTRWRFSPDRILVTTETGDGSGEWVMTSEAAFPRSSQ